MNTANTNADTNTPTTATVAPKCGCCKCATCTCQPCTCCKCKECGCAGK